MSTPSNSSLEYVCLNAAHLVSCKGLTQDLNSLSFYFAMYIFIPPGCEDNLET